MVYSLQRGEEIDASAQPVSLSDHLNRLNKDGDTLEILTGNSNKRHQKDVDAHWTLKIGGNIRYQPEGTPVPQIATPVFGDKNPISIDRCYGFIRKTKAVSAADSDGRQLCDGVDMGNTACSSALSG